MAVRLERGPAHVCVPRVYRGWKGLCATACVWKTCARGYVLQTTCVVWVSLVNRARTRRADMVWRVLTPWRVSPGTRAKDHRRILCV